MLGLKQDLPTVAEISAPDPLFKGSPNGPKHLRPADVMHSQQSLRDSTQPLSGVNRSRKSNRYTPTLQGLLLRGRQCRGRHLHEHDGDGVPETICAAVGVMCAACIWYICTLFKSLD